ncbi:MAG: M20/M25/M40 family metallo-hydrolase, partial [Erysipelotrichaceae bacterium]|nr:M20/M25/M40 family metallo-hydrolase [Erysipelotrichaceae bacterium]
SQTPEGLRFIDQVAKIAERNGIPFETHVRGGLSDANHLSAHCGIIMDGMGPFGQYAHSEDEYTTLDSFEPCVKLLCAILEDKASSL